MTDTADPLEIHTHRNRDVVDAISKAQGVRSEPLELDLRQQDADGRAAHDHERAQADEDAGRAALDLLHGDGEEE